MSRGTSLIDETIRGHGREAVLVPHPEPETLFAYQEGGLSAFERDAVADHLAVCRECTELVLDLEAFPAVPLRDPSKAQSAAEEAASRAAFLAMLPRVDQAPPAPAAKVLEMPAPPARRERRFDWRLAAALVVGVAGAGLWLAGLGNERQGAAGPVVAEGRLVEPAWEHGWRSGETAAAAMPGGRDPLLLLLAPPEGSAPPWIARLELPGRAAEDLRIDAVSPVGAIPLVLPPLGGATGEVVISLRAAGDAAGGTVQAIYRVRLLPPP